jgi:heavy metal translocating P-type ATPase
MKGEDGHSDSFLFASGEVVFLMFAGEMLEAYTVSRSHKRLASLLAKKPVTARLKTVNGYEIVPCETVKKGDILGVFTGDNVPTDGEIVSGSGVLNESTLTGEPLPRDKTVGDKVFAGTINTSSAFDFRATAESRDSVFSKITAFVGDAQKHRAPIEKTADKIAAYVVPSAIGVAAFTFIISLFALNATVTDAVSRALTVLIVACPCALTLATPAAISAAIGNASKSGVLVKNGKAFQVLSSVNTMFFDKTGTVTVGEPYLKSVVLHSAVSEPALLKYAASVESLSSHPLAKAVLDANEGGIYETKDFVSDGGKSLSGVVDGKNIRISKSEKALEAATASDVYIDNVLCGTLLFDDKIRPDAKEAIASLKALKITTAMLTGDNEAQANAVAAAVGIDKAYASLLPLDKAKILTDCAANNTVGKKPAVTMMLGDGVNDAPALSVASVAVSVGEFSSSVASEVADCCLLSPKLSAIPKLITLARRTQKTILFNIFFALSINVTAIILSILGLIEPVIGALLHNVSAIAIALSAAALGFGKKI